jgi:hypothetical protein
VSKLESQDGGGPTELPDDIHLPVTSIEELELVETGLQEPGCFNGLVNLFSLVRKMLILSLHEMNLLLFLKTSVFAKLFLCH